MDCGILERVKKLRKEPVRKEIDARLAELKRNFNSEESVFSELCFCLLTANERAAKGIEIQKKIGDGFLKLPESKLVEFLKKTGYRFYNVRAKYIMEARAKYGRIRETIANIPNNPHRREWLRENFKGLGYKEASHLLRNLGFLDCAILDRHILRLMHDEKIIGEAPKTLNGKKYIEYEKKLAPICEKLGIRQGELDFYLWYLDTSRDGRKGSILK